MAESSEQHGISKSRSIVQYGLFVLVLLGYFSSEALLRRLIYDTPSEKRSSEEAEKLISALPDVLQSYLRAYSKRLEIQDKLKETSNRDERVKLLFELASLSGEGNNRSLMMKVIDESPYSPDVLPAYLAILSTMPDEEALDTFLNYVHNCDIRRPRPRVKMWAAGAHALASRSKQCRLRYFQAMAENGIYNDDLTSYYEELWISAQASSNKELAERAKELYDLSREKALKKVQASRNKK